MVSVEALRACIINVSQQLERIELFGCQQILLKPDKKLKAVLEYICQQSNKLHNCAVYYARQIYFKSRVIDGQILIPLGQKVKTWFGLKNFQIPMPSNLSYDKFYC